jgi:hypothetical protein
MKLAVFKKTKKMCVKNNGVMIRYTMTYSNTVPRSAMHFNGAGFLYLSRRFIWFCALLGHKKCDCFFLVPRSVV